VEITRASVDRRWGPSAKGIDATAGVITFEERKSTVTRGHHSMGAAGGWPGAVTAGSRQ